MSNRLELLQSQISSFEQIRDDAIEVIADANRNLLILGSERNAILGRTATRHLHVVHDSILPKISAYDYPDGVA